MNNRLIYKIVLLFIIHYSLFINPLRASDTLTILFTHDLHSHFDAIENGKCDDAASASLHHSQLSGGYARLATAIRQVRDKAPDKTLLLDAGDVAMGAVYHTLFTSHFAELQLMQAMGYEATTIGNHDFDFGMKALQQAIDNFQLSTLNSQLSIIISNLHGLRGTRDYLILKKGGYRIGIFGLLGKEALSESLIDCFVTRNDGYELQEIRDKRLEMRDERQSSSLHSQLSINNSSLTYTVSIDAAQRMVKFLREEEKVDVVICLSHSGTHPDKQHSEDEQLAREVDGIDVIISGHSHTVLTEPIAVNHTIIGSAGAYGKYLGCIRLVMRAEKRPEPVEYQLIEIDGRLDEDTAIKGEIAHFRALVEQNYFRRLGIQKIDEIIALNPTIIPAEPDSLALGHLVADAFRAAAQSVAQQPIDVAVAPRGTVRADLPAGDITPGNVFNILSLGIGYDSLPGFPLLKVFITGKEIRDLCEVDTGISGALPDARLFFSGLRYHYNPKSLIFNRVKKIEVRDNTGNYTEIKDNQLYSVVCGLYTAKMIGIVKNNSYGILSIVPKNASGEPVNDWKTVVVKDTAGREIKEWIALKNYLQSFPVDNLGVPHIRFTEPLAARQIKEQGFSLTQEINYLNTFALCIYIIIVLLNVTLLLLIYIIIRKIIKCRKKT